MCLACISLLIVTFNFSIKWILVFLNSALGLMLETCGNLCSTHRSWNTYIKHQKQNKHQNDQRYRQQFCFWVKFPLSQTSLKHQEHKKKKILNDTLNRGSIWDFLINGLNYTPRSRVGIWLPAGFDDYKREYIWTFVCSGLAVGSSCCYTVYQGLSNERCDFCLCSHLRFYMGLMINQGVQSDFFFSPWSHPCMQNSAVYCMYNQGCMRVWWYQWPWHHLLPHFTSSFSELLPTSVSEKPKFRYMYFSIWSVQADFCVFVTALEHARD